MRFLYVAPRYHTNQIPIMKGLQERGHEVKFFSYYIGKIEDHTYVKPEVIGYSLLYKFIDAVYVKILHRNDPDAADKKITRGFPPILRLNRKLKEYRPELVIVRERSVYSIVTYLLCKIHHYPTILYNQSPVYEEVKHDFMHRLVRKLTPKVRMTPVMGEAGEGKEWMPGTFFVPFVMDLPDLPKEKEYCEGNTVHLFTVGRYEKRKNLQMMTEVFNLLSKKYQIHLTIAGAYSTELHEKYYKDLKDYIESHQLQQNVTLLKNLSRGEMEEEYRKADLFVLPSTSEPASISQLEAMAFSVSVICSNANGSACYVEEGHNGYLFKDNDKEDLQRVMEKSIRSPQMLEMMGKNAYQDVKEKYQFQTYLEGIEKCIECISGENKKRT